MVRPSDPTARRLATAPNSNPQSKGFQRRNPAGFNRQGPLSWQLGGYYLHIDRNVGVSLGADTWAGVSRSLYNAPGSSNPTSQLYSDKFTTNVFAAFGSADYKCPTRSSWVWRCAMTSKIERSSNLVPNVFDPITGASSTPACRHRPDPRSRRQLQAAPAQAQPQLTTPSNTNLYANWGIGFKSGGFNNTGASATINQFFNNSTGAFGTINAGVFIPDRYRKERSSAFEAGVKGSLADGRVTFDLAGYYTRVTDMQFFEFFVGSFGLLRVVSNIDTVDVKGVEFNTSAQDCRRLDRVRRGQSDRQRDQEEQLAALHCGQQIALYRRLYGQFGQPARSAADRQPRSGGPRRLPDYRADLVPHGPGPEPPDRVQRAAAGFAVRAVLPHPAAAAMAITAPPGAMPMGCSTCGSALRARTGP